MKTTIWERIKSIVNKWIFSIWLFWMKVCLCWIEFFNWWISFFHLIHSFQLEEFNQIIKELNLNHQFWLKSSFLPVEKIIFFQMNYQFQWNDNLFIIEFFLSIFNFHLEWIIWTETLWWVEYTHFNPNTSRKTIGTCFINWPLE